MNITQPAKRLTVYRGIDDISKLNQIRSRGKYGEEYTLNNWSNDSCNILSGSTDGKIFPPFLEDNETLIYEPNLCRTMKIEYSRTLDYYGVPVARFEITERNLGSAEKYPENSCYCPFHDNKLTCPLHGLMDAMGCYTVPVLISLPYFLYGDETLMLNAFGNRSRPKSDEYYIPFVDRQPMIGIPLQGARRLQFNLELRKDASYPFLKNVNPVIIPCLWMEEKAIVSKDNVQYIKKYLNAIYITKIVIIAAIIVGIALLLIGIIIFKYADSSRKIKITSQPKDFTFQRGKMETFQIYEFPNNNPHLKQRDKVFEENFM